MSALWLFEKSRSKRYEACSDVVRVVGVEPTRQRHRNLNPARLPIPSYPRAAAEGAFRAASGAFFILSYDRFSCQRTCAGIWKL